MTKVKLKDATRELLKGAEETLSKLSGMRKNADALAQLAKKQENQFAREEERRRAEEKQAEQARLISQHAKAFTMPDTDDEPKPVQTAPAPKAEEKPATEKAPVKAEAPAKAPAGPKYTEGVKADTESFLRGLLDRMGVKANIAISARDNGGINVELSGSGMGAIIGRRGETLDAIQHLTNYVVNRGSEKHLHISVDAENYRSKREESLTKLAEKMAEKAIKYKRSMALEPMNSYERHVIHTALQNYEGVTTSSTGVEPNRRVVVSYVKPEGGNKPQSREWA